MPQISRYSDEQVEQLLAELLNVLEKHKARALQSSIHEDKAH